VIFTQGKNERFRVTRFRYLDPHLRWSGYAMSVFVDVRLPVGGAQVFRSLVRLFTAVAGADLDARPRMIIERDGVNVRYASVRGGHICVVAGTIP
jgi:hypothetical protein